MLPRLLALVLVLAPLAHADDLREVAREKFAEGRREFAQQHYATALALLRESYALAPFPDLLFNIGRCEEELHHYRAALDAYERYIAVNPVDEDVRRRIVEMRVRSAGEPEPSPEPSPQASLDAPIDQPPLAPLVVTRTRPVPVYKKWWLWTAVVGVAVIAVGVGLGVGLSRAEPSRTFPPLSGQ